ncbi:MAG: hypothetical protein ACOZF0_17010, partial [Thermodesulfobacteriota bacterium]
WRPIWQPIPGSVSARRKSSVYLSMNQELIKSAIIKIELLWSTTLREKSDDLRSFEYITNHSMALKRAVMELKSQIDKRIQQCKQDRLKYQKLRSALANIIETLDFQPTPCKDENYIQNILDKVRKIGFQIKTILEYQ